MKVYDLRRPDDDDYEYPEDMTKILIYLREHGELHVSGKTVERLYRNFSDQSCAYWLSADDETIEQFSDWLDRYYL